MGDESNYGSGYPGAKRREGDIRSGMAAGSPAVRKQVMRDVNAADRRNQYAEKRQPIQKIVNREKYGDNRSDNGNDNDEFPFVGFNQGRERQ